jgi:DNA repair protein RecO (recombination protein O)
MTRPRVYQTEAIVIKRTKLGEADRILTLYTPGYGKVRAVAKGSRRTTSKLGGHVELLTHSTLLLASGRNLDIITQAQTINSFMPLKEDLQLMSCGLYISELIDAFTEEDEESQQVFMLLRDTLDQLSQGLKSDTVLRYFEIHLLELTGYRPQLQQCANCGAPLRPVQNYFSSSQGGALCSDCSYEEPIVLPLSLNALKVLRLWQNCNFATAVKVTIRQDLAQEMEQLLRDYVKYILDRQLKSTSWLDMIKK